MRFLCDSCRAQYMISDDKVGPRGVKVRCKKCGYVILVRRAESAAANAEPPAPAPDGDHREAGGASAPSGAPGILQGVADDEIGAVFDQALRPGDGQPGAAGEVGLVAGPEQQEPLEQAGGAPFDEGGAATASTTQTAAAAQDWFVAIDEKQVGPLTLEKIRDLWNRGELAADSLCWRAGLPDWVALSEAPELASLLAPKPVKPVIVAPAPLGQTVASSPAPVESAFSAGLTPRGLALDGAVASAAPSSPEQTGSWRPSAASALASLVKEEIEVMAKPTTRAAVAPPEAEVAAGGVLGDVAAAVNGHAGASPSVRQTGQNGAAAVVAPIAISEPYPSLYPVPAARGARRGWIIGLSIAGGVSLLALAVVTTMLLVRSGSSEPAAARSPRAEVSGRQSVTPPPLQERSAPPAGNPPATSTSQAQGAPAQPPPKETASAAVNAEPSATGHYERGTRRERNRLAHRASSDEITVPRKPERTEVASAAGTAPSRNSAEDDFDRVFGGAEKRKSAIPKAEPRKPSSVYVPPAPGSGEIPDSLGTADIMRVVVDNKPTIKQCVDEQRKRDASLSGKIVMSWTILASGKTANVSCSSDEFKSSYMAHCLAGLIKGWQFPRHKVQGEQINFPFTF